MGENQRFIPENDKFHMNRKNYRIKQKRCIFVAWEEEEDADSSGSYPNLLGQINDIKVS